jgi:hypothetical protein
MGAAIVIKIPIDESGVHEGSPVLTVAAYAARPKQWQQWTKRWNAAKRPIKVFHAVDCQNFAGEFKGWDAERREPLVIRLLGVIREAGIPGLVIGLHMEAFREAMADRGDLHAIFGSPYAACFQWLVQVFINCAIDAKWSGW